MTSKEFIRLVNTGNCTSLNLQANIGTHLTVEAVIDGNPIKHEFKEDGVIQKIDSNEHNTINIHTYFSTIQIERNLDSEPDDKIV